MTTLTTLTSAPTTPTRTGSVRILWDAMAQTLGDSCRAFSPATLALSGSLLVRITSQTRQGPVSADYRILKVNGGYQLSKCVVTARGWQRDCGESYFLDLSFGGGVVRCGCQDAKLRCHCPKTGSQCKHRKAAAKLELV